MRVDPNDGRAVALEMGGGSIDHVLTDLWSALYRALRPTTVIDVGANYGEVLLALEYDPGTVVTAIEPNPKVASCLRATLRENMCDHVALYEMAVGDEAGTLPLFVDPRWSGRSSIQAPEGTVEVVDVAVCRLDDLVSRPCGREVLMKIDVEGAELRVLRGAEQLLSEATVSVVLAEITHTDSQSLLDWAAKMVMECYVVDRRRRIVRSADVGSLDAAKGDVAHHPYLRDVLLVSGGEQGVDFVRRLAPAFRFVDLAES